MSKVTLLPPTETDTLKSLDVAYRSMIPAHTKSIDLNPMTCDAKLLPYLAQCVQVLYWDDLWSESEKRRFVRDAREVHRHIGTPYALAKMFESLGIRATLKEWYEYGAEPYHFSVDLSLEQKEIYPELVANLRKYITVYKNVRTVLDKLTLSYQATFKSKSKIGGIFNMTASAQSVDSFITTARANQNLRVGGVFNMSATVQGA